MSCGSGLIARARLSFSFSWFYLPHKDVTATREHIFLRSWNIEWGETVVHRVEGGGGGGGEKGKGNTRLTHNWVLIANSTRRLSPSRPTRPLEANILFFTLNHSRSEIFYSEQPVRYTSSILLRFNTAKQNCARWRKKRAAILLFLALFSFFFFVKNIFFCHYIPPRIWRAERN